MKDVFNPTSEQRNIMAFMDKIRVYFDEHEELGKIKRYGLLDPWGHGNRYYVKCTRRREYIVYEKNGEVHNVGIYKEGFL